MKGLIWLSFLLCVVTTSNRNNYTNTLFLQWIFVNVQMKEMRLPKIVLIVDQVGKYEDNTIVVCDAARFGIDLRHAQSQYR